MCVRLCADPYSTGVETPPPKKKSVQKFLGLPVCCTVEHVQLKNVTVDFMNIIVTITVGVKCAPERIKMHNFDEKKYKNFSEERAQCPRQTTPHRRLQHLYSSALGT